MTILDIVPSGTVTGSISFPRAIFSMTTSLVSGGDVLVNTHNILQISELSTNFLNFSQLFHGFR